jgi:hypothetical protein
MNAELFAAASIALFPVLLLVIPLLLGSLERKLLVPPPAVDGPDAEDQP